MKRSHDDLEADEGQITGRLEYPERTSVPNHVPQFQYPLQLVSFSYTPARVLEFTDSALRYYVEPPRGADLNFRYENWTKRPEERGRLDGLLRACVHERVSGERARASVLSWRGVMTKILTAPYEERDSWNLNVMFVNGTLYLEEHSDESMLKRKEDQTPRNRLQTYYGYSFESYCTSSDPDSSEDRSRPLSGWGGDVDTNVQWCSVVKTKLGVNRLIIGGEVDCVRGRYTGQPTTFVELKTSLAIRNPQDEARFEKKLLKFYFQSFLLGVPEIVVGFRTPAGRLTELQTFKTVQLPRLVRGKPGGWDPNICLDWGCRFLDFLKSYIQQSGATSEPVTKRPNTTSSESLSDSSHSTQDRIWRVNFSPGKGIVVKELDDEAVKEVLNGEDRVGILPRWYWDKVATQREQPRESFT